MHFIITDDRRATRHFHLSRARLALAFSVLSLALLLSAVALVRVALQGAREGWPLVGALAPLSAQDDLRRDDRFLRENIDAMARRLGEMQARMLQVEALSERVSGLAGLKPNAPKPPAGRGGALVSGRPLTLEELQATLDDLEQLTGERTDLLTVVESRLIDQRLKTAMVPTQHPLQRGELGSRFGWRIDPFSGRQALHTGLDFQAGAGTPIAAAAGGVVVTAEMHPLYGNLVELDHGNGLVTRYAHASRLLVRKGDLVKRGQQLALVGSTGRSTGPHLHFEVLVQGVPQDPQKFLAAGQKQAQPVLAAAAADR